MKTRTRISIKGAVQGVGFRPFIYRLASEKNLYGYVNNSSSGVVIEVEGEKEKVDEFLLRIEKEKPHHAIIQSLEFSFLDPKNYTDFRIIESKAEGKPETLILPDIAVCDDCLNELFDPQNRRYLYPFINCTNCGPRFSIIESLPYDRPNTTMREFEMCDGCRKEYENPENRRFHAQPIACPNCGPWAELWNKDGNQVSTKNKALIETAEMIKEGKIVALKGLGGFQLLADARNTETIKLLRKRKHRDEKPFALMFPSLELIRKICIVSKFEERLLKSPESPIVLLKRIDNDDQIISEEISPQNPYLGVMLPYTPLHHIMMKELGFPIVATSGNISDEPMCIDNKEALERLKNIADYFLVHNRKIVRPVDDSIARIVNGREMITRRSRGYAPLPINLGKSKPVKNNFIAVGAELKNTIAINSNLHSSIYVSQHIGDLSTEEANNNFYKTIKDFQELYEVKADCIVHDMHPDYISSKYAKDQNLKLIPVQHHLAHVASCYHENEIEGEVVGVSWDGTGYGLDKSIWGSEFFIYNGKNFEHVAQLKQYKIPGGDKAIKDIKRSALGVLYDIYGKNVQTNSSIKSEFLNFKEPVLAADRFDILIKMLDQNINCFSTSSMGRLFDAVSYLLKVCNYSYYEGQAAMLLEFAAESGCTEHYSFNISKDDIYIINWHQIIEDLIEDLKNKMPVPTISAKFHNTLIEIILEIVKLIGKERTVPTSLMSGVVLSGGCFQNIYLLKGTIAKIKEAGFNPYWHQRIPANDGGISYGQINYAMNLPADNLRKD